MTSQFQRRVKITFSRSGSPTLTVDENLAISFGIARSIGSETDPSFVDVINLSAQSRSLISASDHVRVEAGYGSSSLGLVGEGDKRRVYHVKDRLDWITSVTLGGADTARRALFVRAYQAVPLRTIIEDAAMAMKLELDAASAQLLPAETLSDFSHDGYARDALTELLYAHGLGWYEVDGQLLFRRAGQPLRRGVRIISEATGMIGSPTEEVEDASHEIGGVVGFVIDATQPLTDFASGLLGGGGGQPASGDWRVKTLLDPLVSLDDEVEIRSQVVSGRFVTTSVNHVGASREGDFYTELLVAGSE